jgi:hypothetical protein
MVLLDGGVGMSEQWYCPNCGPCKDSYPSNSGEPWCLGCGTDVIKIPAHFAALQAENAKLKRLNSELVDKSNSYVIANARLDEENAKLRKVADTAVKLRGRLNEAGIETPWLDEALNEAGYAL